MTTFGLVHGAWHGAWSFELLVPELEALGHRAVAIDLPCDDVDAGVSRYAEVALEAVHGVDDLVLVGKSLGGLTVPIVASRRPVRHIVYVAALLPRPGEPFSRRRSEGYNDTGFGEGAIERDELGRTFWTDRDKFFYDAYHDCPRELSDRAFDRLRPQAVTPFSEPSPLERLPEVPSTYVICTEDRVVSTEWSYRVAREELGVEPLVLPGSHAPETARPAELARVLAEAVPA